jgi:hypothetical protein
MAEYALLTEVVKGFRVEIAIDPKLPKPENVSS